MFDYNNPCMGCEYYMKPYWSIESPGKNCPRQSLFRECIEPYIVYPIATWLPVQNSGIGNTAKCSNCEESIYGYKTFNFCPMCGAKVIKEES